MNIKTISLLFVIIIILNFILFIYRIINQLVFWITIIVIALFAYKILPKIKKK